MVDIEKVIKALELCYSGCFAKSADECSYSYTEDHVCIMNLIIDAAALLKAMKPRVLTPEEIADWDGAFMLEDRDGKLAWATWYADYTTNSGVKLRRLIGLFDAIGEDEIDDRRADGYGYLWRVWSARPTEKQMMEAKWG